MEEKEKESIALFRFSLIADYVSGQSEEKRPWAYFKNVGEKKYQYVDGSLVNVSPTSCVRWAKAYLKDGFDGLKPLDRDDIGKCRKVDDEIVSQIEYFIEEFPKLPGVHIYEKLKDNGLIEGKSPSLSTIQRLVRDIKKRGGNKNITERRRYEKEHINELWYGDTAYGPYIHEEKGNIRTYIIALIDDASRMIVSAKAYYEDDFINLMDALKKAVSRYGVPKVLSFDNGSNYKAKQMKLLAARVGVSLNYCPPRTPQSKAKIERWFKTLRSQFLSALKPGDYKTLDDFNKALSIYVQSYNNAPHSSLNGQSPIERFFKESKLIRRKSDEEIERDFVLEEERRVSADSVIVLNEKEYEIDYHYQNQKVLIRYSPDMKNVFVIDKDNKDSHRISLLDKHSNSHMKREKVRLTDIEEEVTES